MAYNQIPTVVTGQMWTAADHNTYIRDNQAASVPDIFTTKGDMAVAAGADIADRLPVGTDRQVLVADSSQPLGVKWSAPCPITRAYKAVPVSNQTINSGLVANIVFSAEAIDELDAFDAAVSTYQFTLKEAGWYMAAGHLYTSGGTATGYYSVETYRNGSPDVGLGYASFFGLAPHAQFHTPVFHADANDVITFRFNNQSGGNITISNAELSIIKIG